MRNFFSHSFAKMIIAVIVLVIIGAGLFSMSAMSHGPGNTDSCQLSMTEHNNCENPAQAEACVDFHFGLLEKFSHGQAPKSGPEFFAVLLALGVAYFALGNLLYSLKNYVTILLVRLKQLVIDTAGVFYDNLGYWLIIFEKRDPSHAFFIA